MPLTDVKIRQAKATDKAIKVADSAGLYLEVKPNGSKLWRYRYRIAGRENLYAIGDYPSVSLADARKARDEGQDIKLIVHSRLMLARRGLLVLGVPHGGQLIGLRNLTTGEQVNFVRSAASLASVRWRGARFARRCVCDGVGCETAWGAGRRRRHVVGLAPCARVDSRAMDQAALARRRRGRCHIDAAQRQAAAHHGLRRVK